MDDNQVSPLQTAILFGVIIVAIVIGSVLLLVTRPDPVEIIINPPLPTATPPPTATPGPILVYVTGEVNNPETTLTLPAGSRVRDVLRAAGGITDVADMERVNLVGVVRDGDQIHVPALGASDNDVEALALPTASGGGLVFINTATAAALETLPGVGPALAARILDYRTANGPFANLEALDAVDGIGPATLEDLAPLIIFD